jgi:hypothetical protein
MLNGYMARDPLSLALESAGENSELSPRYVLLLEVS